jgi:hypothetical protein
LSREHFSVDGTLIEAWASMKSFHPKGGDDLPPGGGRNGSRDFHGEQRRNDTHASTTDGEARLFRKGAGKEARLCFMGHLLMENRSGLVVAARLTQATGLAEREAASGLIENLPGRHRITVGADRAYDTAGFVAGLRELNATPHVAQNISGRTSRISAANIGPKRFHQYRTVSWLISMPRSCRRSSTFRSDSGNRTYIITSRRITSGDVLK